MKRIYLLSGMCLLVFVLFSASAQNSKKVKAEHTLHQADSLFIASSWKTAIPVYEAVLKYAPENSLAWNRLGFCYHNLGEYDRALLNYKKSLDYKPAPMLLVRVQSRIARIYALKNEKESAFASLEKAIESGYKSVGELQDEKEFNSLRSDARFLQVIARAKNNAFPCMTDARLREFDFWIGEWDVYPKGANAIVGHSRVEMASGGCMILENWTAVGPVPHTGKSMNYVNDASGKWEQLWIGSGGINRNNPQKFVDGVYANGAMRFTFEQVTLQGRKQTGRFIFYNEGPDQVRQFNEVSDNGKTWTTVYDFVYKRRK